MAKCDEGYLCEVCGEDVAQVTDSDLYLRYVIGLLDPELLHATPERHIRCNPVLAQFIVDDGFEPVIVEDEFSKANLDSEYCRKSSRRGIAVDRRTPTRGTGEGRSLRLSDGFVYLARALSSFGQFLLIRNRETGAFPRCPKAVL